MIRRKIEEDEDNHERWLVSYADFITLLFAFFVVMYAISSVNEKKYDALSSAMNSAFTNEKITKNDSSPVTTKQKSPKKTAHKLIAPKRYLSEDQIGKIQKEREAMGALGDDLAENLSNLISENKIQVIQNNRGLQINISDSLLFETGSAELSTSATELLNTIAALMHQNNHAIQVEGHTDDTPIHTPMFFSNWELSAVRASSVVRMFSSFGIEENRLSALGFGSTQPISENITSDGRAKNRRVSIMIIYDSLKHDNNDDREIQPKSTPSSLMQKTL